MSAPVMKAPTVQDFEWQLQGTCRGLISDETFFADRTSKKSTEKAKQICKECPVIAECATWALENMEMYGVWGGLDRHERAAILGITIAR